MTSVEKEMNLENIVQINVQIFSENYRNFDLNVFVLFFFFFHEFVVSFNVVVSVCV